VACAVPARERLGHLDPYRIADGELAVRDAIQCPPKLHRYVEKMPGWIVSAARRVVKQYEGDATSMWAHAPRADELQHRFDAFTGIGQKKAAMAVEILERDLGVRVQDMDRSDVAYDVHVRRVFLRTRLADRDESSHVIAMARQLNPDRPGALDLPAWLIGRGWCHAGIPSRATCPLTDVCAKDIERAAHVTSG
jgi:endonuclease III